MNGEDRTTSAFAGTLLPPFLAVVGVTAILTALFVWVGPDDADTDVLSVRTATPSSAAPTPTATPPASSPPASSPAASTPAPATSSPPVSAKPGPDLPEVV